MAINGWAILEAATLVMEDRSMATPTFTHRAAAEEKTYGTTAARAPAPLPNDPTALPSAGDFGRG